MDIRETVLRQLKNHREGFSLEQPFYIDQDYFKLDMEMIWYRDWLFMGHDCEIPRPGNYFTVQIGDYPVVIVRGARQDHPRLPQYCRHRGHRVCTAEKGASAKLVCPYHQWTYDLDGSLVFARQMGEDFDKAQFGMKQVHCESVGGYIFICLAEEAPDFSAVRQTIEPYIAPHRLWESKVAFESTIVEKGNWKLVWENNRECYHCAGNIPNSAAPIRKRLRQPACKVPPTIRSFQNTGSAASRRACFHLHHASKRPVPCGPHAIVEDAESYTMSGACRQAPAV